MSTSEEKVGRAAKGLARVVCGLVAYAVSDELVAGLISQMELGDLVLVELADAAMGTD